MKKKLVLLALLLTLTLFVVFAVYFISTNTSLLNKNPNVEDISKNNAATIESLTEADFSNLVSKDVEVASTIKSSVFSERRTLNLPKQFNVAVYAAGMTSPRFLTLDNANNAFVTDIAAGKVFMIKETTGDNVADELITVDSGLRSPHGIEYFNNDLYVGEEHQVVVYRGVDENGKYKLKELLVPNLPSGNIFSQGGGHKTRTVKIGPDNKLYVAIGSSCNVCEEDDKRRAAIMRYNLDGQGGEIFAEGLRNTVGFVFDTQKRIWGVDNGRDLIGDDIPADEVNVIQIGNHYGWPYCYGMGIANPEYPQRVDFCENSAKDPIYEIQAHSAPLGLSFSNWENLDDNLFIALHGSWNRTTPTGYKIVRIDTSNQFAKPTNFITGWLKDDGTVWGRPVDVKFMESGKMLITDDKAGVVYIVYPAD